MSSEYSIHLEDKPIEGRVYDLGSQSGIMATVEVEAQSNSGAAHRLFIPRDRLLEASLLFHKIAQDLAALLPDVDACCRCVPGTPDDQCAEHGYGADKIKQAAGVCPLCDEPAEGGLVHQECVCREQCRADAEAEAKREPTDTIPIDEAGEHVEPPHRWG